MRKTAVFNVVGLTPQLLRHMPRVSEFARRGAVASIGHVTPAVTCSVQATYLCGCLPTEHGIVGNGWYDRDEREIRFWKQSDGLVQRPRVWEIARARDAGFTGANLFWWYAMYSRADTTVTPRPMYPADGRKVPDIWTPPPVPCVTNCNASWGSSRCLISGARGPTSPRRAGSPMPRWTCSRITR